MRRIELAIACALTLAIVVLPQPAHAHGDKMFLAFSVVALAAPYLVFLLSALTPWMLGASLQMESMAQALFWAQAVLTLGAGSLLIGTICAGNAPGMALVYAPGQAAVLVVSFWKAPAFGRAWVPWWLAAPALVPGLIALLW